MCAYPTPHIVTVVRPFNLMRIKTLPRYFLSTREDAPGEQHLYRVKDTKDDDKGLECLTCDLSSGASNISDSSASNADDVECSFVDVHFSPTADFFIRECLGPDVPTTALVATHNNTVCALIITFIYIIIFIVTIKIYIDVCGISDTGLG